MDRVEFLTELKQDIGYAFRMLRRTPAFTTAALLTLALGIGANSAIFSVVNGVLLRSLPFRDPDHLHQVQMLYPDGTRYSSLSAPDFMSIRADAHVFEQVEAWTTRSLSTLGAGEPREIIGAEVSGGLFDMLGLHVALGRNFAAEENQPGRGNVTILSHGFWQRVFGGDAAVLGRSISSGGTAYTIVGVASPDSELPDQADAFFPLTYGQAFDASAMNSTVPAPT